MTTHCFLAAAPFPCGFPAAEKLLEINRRSSMLASFVPGGSPPNIDTANLRAGRKSDSCSSRPAKTVTQRRREGQFRYFAYPKYQSLRGLPIIRFGKTRI